MKSNVLEFWQAIEALTPQDALRVNPSEVANPVYGVKSSAQALFPWQDVDHLAKPIEPNMTWVYDAQCGLYETEKLATLVVEALSRVDDGVNVDRSGTARLFDLRFNASGIPVAQSFSLSLSAWASGFLLREGATLAELLNGGRVEQPGLPEPSSEVANPQSGFAGYDALSMGLIQWISVEVERLLELHESPSVDWLKALVELVTDHLNIPEQVVSGSALARVRATRLRKDYAQDTQDITEGLNSFYTADLRNIISAVRKGDCGQGLMQFLSGGTVASVRGRVDVRDPGSNEILEEALSPKNMPKGRWPADHALAFSQQLAVNSIFDSLRNSAGLFSVNGPPGTGKTTLLRDVVAEVVTERASQLVKLGSKAFGERTLTKVGEVVAPFYELHKSLSGYSIVVATNGNGAAENVTLELPGLDSVPNRVSSTSRYFPELAEIVANKKAWGLIAAPLGNRRNRTDFVSRFWWGQRKSRTEGATSHAMRDHLRALVNGQHAPEVSWDAAVTRFKSALQRESQSRKRVLEIASLPQKIAALLTQGQRSELDLHAMENEHAQSRVWLQEAAKRGQELASVIVTAHAQDAHLCEALRHHNESKPGLWTILSSIGKVKASWHSSGQALAQEREGIREWRGQVEREANELSRSTNERNIAHARLTLRIASATADLASIRTTRIALERSLDDAVQHLGSSWVDVEKEQDSRERLTPWGEREWLAAREEVFTAALEVHRAFLEANPVQMAANLAIACDWLSGKRIDRALVSNALDTLCMVVPVVSATFASFPRMFAKAPRESVGYLLVDEGGQAQASHVACAIWRARRTVIVGDPLQLEPVVTIPEGIESELARHFNVDTPWMPSWNSAQGLADLSSRLGTSLETVPGEKLWIGCPLRLHRRCDPEMFRISNEVAYGGLMVYGKQHISNESWPATAWIDVKATTSVGHWVDAEGSRLQALVGQLTELGVARDQIALISPFRDCASRLRPIARAFDLDLGKVGTVHTAQGKEADVVILVLGGNPRSAGAKAWAASKPNLLNVAVSRGKKRLYVIGDVDLWRQHSYFSVMARQLDVKNEYAI